MSADKDAPSAELFPDPIAEAPRREGLPRWFWIALVPVGLVVLLVLGGLAFGFVAAFAEVFETASPSSGHDPYPEPTAADRAAVMCVADLPAISGFDPDPEAESLQKVHYENDTLGLDYEYFDDEAYVYSSIDEEASVDDAVGTYEVLCADDDPDYELHDELFRWGDASSFYVYVQDGEPYGYMFAGRRGKRVVWASWGGSAYLSMDPLTLGRFLMPIVERMASHELEP